MPPLRLISFSLLTISALRVAAGADWKDKSFPDWTDSTILRLVTDSPWAKPKTVRFTWTKRGEQPFTYKDVPGADHNAPLSTGSPVGGIGAPKSKLPDRADIIIRWASALPVRQAKALYQQRDEKGAGGPVVPPESDYVLELFGVPAVVAHQGTGSVESVVRQSVYLRTRTGRTIKPTSVEVTIHDLNLTILIHFPRTIPIELSDKEVECSGDVQLFEFKERFKLSSMVYQDRLEL